jgi:hypothetical protein
MKKFEIPELEIQKFELIDVITTSIPGGDITGETPED